MTITVALENYTVMAKHGYYEFEHEEQQPFNFTVWATIIDHSIAGKLVNTLNYADIQIAIDAIKAAGKSHNFLSVTKV